MSFIVREIETSQMTSIDKSEVTCPTLDDAADYIRIQAYSINKAKHFIIVPVNEHKADKE